MANFTGGWNEFNRYEWYIHPIFYTSVNIITSLISVYLLMMFFRKEFGRELENVPKIFRYGNCVKNSSKKPIRTIIQRS